MRLCGRRYQCIDDWQVQYSDIGKKRRAAVMFTMRFSEWTWQNIFVRIVFSLVLGIVIGIDRGAKRRGGGARTTITVCLGAAMVMLMEQYLEALYPERLDISRIAAQVISGVGFLGAGSILVSGHQIKGLTSAASIWTCALVLQWALVFLTVRSFSPRYGYLACIWCH